MKRHAWPLRLSLKLVLGLREAVLSFRFDAVHVHFGG